MQSAKITPPRAYIPELDIIKGIAILLVIMGHSFCEFPIDIRGAAPQYLKDFIAYAQMPLFFIVSGLLFSVKTDWNTMLKKKLPRLIIPYITFSIVASGLRMIFSAYTHSKAPSISEAVIRLITGEGYWFLYALFVMMTLCMLLRKNFFVVTTALLAICITLCVDIQSDILIRICQYLPYFIFGLMIKDYYGHLRKISNKMACGTMIGGIALYLFLLYPEFHNKEIKWLILYLIPLIGCVGYWGLAILIGRLSGEKIKYITFFGKYSLQYYLNHIPIMLLCYYAVKFMGLQNVIMQWLTVFVLGVCIASVMLWIEMKVKPLAYLSGLPKKKALKNA